MERFYLKILYGAVSPAGIFLIRMVGIAIKVVQSARSFCVCVARRIMYVFIRPIGVPSIISFIDCF